MSQEEPKSVGNTRKRDSEGNFVAKTSSEDLEHVPTRKQIQTRARRASVTAINSMVKILRSGKAKDSAKCAAALVVLDRAWGKPAQSLAVTDPQGEAFREQMRERVAKLSDKMLETEIARMELEQTRLVKVAVQAAQASSKVGEASDLEPGDVEH